MMNKVKNFIRKWFASFAGALVGVVVMANIAAAAFPSTLSSWNPRDVITSSWADALEAAIGEQATTTNTGSLRYLLTNGLFGSTATTTISGNNSSSTFKGPILSSGMISGTLGEFAFLKATSTNATSTIAAGLNANLLHSATQLVLAGLPSCDTLDTDASGVVKCGSDNTAAGNTADLQDAYNASADDAEILTADAKDLILALADTTTDPNLVISVASDGQGQLQLAVGSTTNAVWEGYGRLGIGTSTPGAGLSVNATTTILGADVYIFGQLNLRNFVGTSTANNSGLGTTSPGQLLSIGGTALLGGNTSIVGVLDVQSTATSTIDGGLAVTLTGGLASAQGLTITGGDIESVGKLTITGSGTSTLPSLNASTLSSAALFYGSGTATSTLEGGLQVRSIGGLSSASGLIITGGHILSSGRLEVTSAATSSIAGSLAVTGTATSSISTDLLLNKNLVIDGGGARNETFVVPAGATMVVDGALGTKFVLIPTQDSAITFKNFGAGQTATLLVTLTSDLLSVSFPSTSPMLKANSASTTLRNLLTGDNVCSFWFPTSTATGYGGCNQSYTNEW